MLESGAWSSSPDSSGNCFGRDYDDYWGDGNGRSNYNWIRNGDRIRNANLLVLLFADFRL